MACGCRDISFSLSYYSMMGSILFPYHNRCPFSIPIHSRGVCQQHRYDGDPTKDYSAIIDTYIRRFLLLTHKSPFRRTYQSNDDRERACDEIAVDPSPEPAIVALLD